MNDSIRTIDLNDVVTRLAELLQAGWLVPAAATQVGLPKRTCYRLVKQNLALNQIYLEKTEERRFTRLLRGLDVAVGTVLQRTDEGWKITHPLLKKELTILP